jgi:hypothetical protein
MMFQPCFLAVETKERISAKSKTLKLFHEEPEAESCTSGTEVHCTLQRPEAAGDILTKLRPVSLRLRRLLFD